MLHTARLCSTPRWELFSVSEAFWESGATRLWSVHARLLTTQPQCSSCAWHCHQSKVLARPSGQCLIWSVSHALQKDEFLRLAINAIHNDLISRNEAFQSLALTFVSNSELVATAAVAALGSGDNCMQPSMHSCGRGSCFNSMQS